MSDQQLRQATFIFVVPIDGKMITELRLVFRDYEQAGKKTHSRTQQLSQRPWQLVLDQAGRRRLHLLHAAQLSLRILYRRVTKIIIVNAQLLVKSVFLIRPAREYTEDDGVHVPHQEAANIPAAGIESV